MKVIVLVIDSFGIGAAPDAEQYGDMGSNTAVNIGKALGAANWPFLQKNGLGNIALLSGSEIPGCPPAATISSSTALLQEVSKGKDTTTGHWELAGIVLDKAFRTFSREFPSFPAELTEEFERRIGCSILGNIAASGTRIIQELGDEHCRTGKPIVYTSSDSVFQIAAHESVVPVKQLYTYCEIARELCDTYQIGRVIARPFEGTSGNYIRTSRRHDYSIPLPGPCLMDHLRENGIKTISVGKIADIFNGQGIDENFPEKGNEACLERTMQLIDTQNDENQFIFVNLVDTDMIFGHRRDPQGYHDAVSAVDTALSSIAARLKSEDVMMITADHGCDPTFSGTDHTREYVPYIEYSSQTEPVEYGKQQGFHFLSKRVCNIFKISLFPKV